MPGYNPVPVVKKANKKKIGSRCMASSTYVRPYKTDTKQNKVVDPGWTSAT